MDFPATRLGTDRCYYSGPDMQAAACAPADAVVESQYIFGTLFELRIKFRDAQARHMRKWPLAIGVFPLLASLRFV